MADALCLAFNPSGQRLAVGCANKYADLYDVTSWIKLRSFGEHGGPVVSLALSPDGCTLATSAGGITLWDLRTGKAQVHLEADGAMAFAPDGRTLVTWGAKGLAV